MEDYLNRVQSVSTMQDSAVNEALELSSKITEAGDAIKRLAGAARILALNAGIEASRTGGRGDAFGIIADQMSQLSIEIVSTNKLVSNAAISISQQLPVITEQASVQKQELEGFMQKMQGYRDVTEKILVSTGDSSNTRIDTILELANTALSHMQFQDPMIQSLQKIEHLMLQLRTAISEKMESPFASEQTAAVYDIGLGSSYDDTLSDKPERDAGDVLMF